MNMHEYKCDSIHDFRFNTIEISGTKMNISSMDFTIKITFVSLKKTFTASLPICFFGMCREFFIYLTNLLRVT